MFDSVLYALLRKYINESLIGAGALKGASCQILSIERNLTDDGTVVTFKYEDNAGGVHTSTMNVPDGAKGDKGEDGQDGKSFDIKGQYPSYAALIAAHPTGSAGEAYFVGADDDSDLYIWLTDDATWYNNGKFAGATPTVSATATVDNTSGTPSVSVTKTGTASNPEFTFAFSGIKGESGETDISDAEWSQINTILS